jgi:hypothetical protein
MKKLAKISAYPVHITNSLGSKARKINDLERVPRSRKRPQQGPQSFLTSYFVIRVVARASAAMCGGFRLQMKSRHWPLLPPTIYAPTPSLPQG